MLSPRNIFSGKLTDERQYVLSDNDEFECNDLKDGGGEGASNAGKVSRPTTPASRPTSPALSIVQSLSTFLSGDDAAADGDAGNGVPHVNSILDVDGDSSDDDDTTLLSYENPPSRKKRVSISEPTIPNEHTIGEDESTLGDDATFTSNEFSPRSAISANSTANSPKHGPSLLNQAKKRRPAKIHKSAVSLKELDIPDDESEASLMVLIRYMGCTPRPYGHPKDDGLPSGKEFVFDSDDDADDDQSTLSGGTFTSGYSKTNRRGYSFSKSKDDEGVEVRMDDFVVQVPSPPSILADDQSHKSTHSKKSKPNLKVDTDPYLSRKNTSLKSPLASTSSKKEQVKFKSPLSTTSSNELPGKAMANSNSDKAMVKSPLSTASSKVLPTKAQTASSDQSKVKSPLSTTSSKVSTVSRQTPTALSGIKGPINATLPTPLSCKSVTSSSSLPRDNAWEKNSAISSSSTSALQSPLMKKMDGLVLGQSLLSNYNATDGNSTIPNRTSCPNAWIAGVPPILSESTSNDTAESKTVRSNKENSGTVEHAAFQSIPNPASLSFASSSAEESTSADDAMMGESSIGKNGSEELYNEVDRILAAAQSSAQSVVSQKIMKAPPAPLNIKEIEKKVAAIKMDPLSPLTVASQPLSPTKKSVRDVHELLSQTRQWLERHNESQKAKSALIRGETIIAKKIGSVADANAAAAVGATNGRKVMSNITTQTVSATKNTALAATPRTANGSITSKSELALTGKSRTGNLDRYLKKSTALSETVVLKELSSSSVRFKERRGVGGVTGPKSPDAASVASLDLAPSSSTVGTQKSILEELSELRSKQQSNATNVVKPTSGNISDSYGVEGKFSKNLDLSSATVLNMINRTQVGLNMES